MLDDGIIRESRSPWASPIVLVAKKGDKEGESKTRFCCDLRKLNAITVRDSFPLPVAADMFDIVGKANLLFSAL
jgi:hypothetical protein